MHVLVAEDDSQLAAMIVTRLAEQGHSADHARSGPEALSFVSQTLPDVVVLDRMLPGRDGISVLRKWRQDGFDVPVLLLTALDGIDDRVEGLDAGADDYLGKPFAFTELLARLNALARRQPMVSHDVVLKAGLLTMNLLKRKVLCRNIAIPVQPREFQLLEELMRGRGGVVTRQMLLEKVWGFHFDPQTNIVETHMSRLRSKLAEAGATDCIQTIRGVGYRLHVA